MITSIMHCAFCHGHVHEFCAILLTRLILKETASSTRSTSLHQLLRELTEVVKLDYCNSLYYNLPKSQINRFQQIQNCRARAVVKAPKSSLITPILRSLHWLKINERIEYKLLSLTYKVLTTSQPDCLHTLFSLQVEPAPHLLSP